MAKPKKDAEPADATAQHNSKDRKRIINEAIGEIATLAAQRKAISEQIASIKAEKIKGHLGMKIADFNAAYRLSQLEGEDRDEFFDTLRETFEALGEGGQLDFIDAMKRPAPEAGAEASDTPEGAHAAGFAAGKAGKNLDTCPASIKRYRSLRAKWEEGWEAGQLENLPAGPRNGSETRASA